MTEKILVEHLVKKYGDNTVLNDINVSINEGDVVCVIGPSGSGKSTFLRCLNQLEEASSGDIIIDGANLTDKNTDINQVRQHIGMVFQHFNLFPHLSILENIVFDHQIKNLDRHLFYLPTQHVLKVLTLFSPLHLLTSDLDRKSVV